MLNYVFSWTVRPKIESVNYYRMETGLFIEILLSNNAALSVFPFSGFNYHIEFI